MKRLAKSFIFAGKGFLFCLKNERNMRIHFMLSIYMYFFLFFFDYFKLTRTGFAVILLTNALVFALEILNTSIENVTNLLTETYHKYAEIAKDTAAAAVLVGAVFSVAIGVFLLYQPAAFQALYAYYKEHTGMLVLLIISLILSFLYIFLGSQGIKQKIFKKQ